MTYPNWLFISAFEGQQSGFDFESSHGRHLASGWDWVPLLQRFDYSVVIIFSVVTNCTDDDGAVIDYFIKCHIA